MSDHLTDRRPLTFLSWNVRGLHNPQKIRKVVAYLDRHKIDVACLQEKHFSDLRAQHIGTRWASLRLTSSYSSYARGVLIWVKSTIPFTHLKSVWDDQGRFVMLQGNYGGSILTIVNVYGPNTDDPSIYAKIWSTLRDMQPGTIIWGGL